MTSTSMMTRRVFHDDFHSSFTFVLYRLDQNAYKTKVRQSVTVKWQRRPLQSPAASIPVRRCRPMPSASLLLEFSWVYIHSPTYRSTFCSSVSGIQQHTCCTSVSPLIATTNERHYGSHVSQPSIAACCWLTDPSTCRSHCCLFSVRVSVLCHRPL